jgi:predicted phage terminase large subunit-like protein
VLQKRIAPEQHAPNINPISLTDFKRQLYRRYLHGTHLDALDHLLTQVTRYVETRGREGIGRAIIEMPPRHGKTVTTSRLYPTWHLGRNPDHRIILVSYGATLAEKNSRYARNLIQSPRYTDLFPHVRLAKDSKAADAWDLDGYEGGMDAMGIGGGVTGKGSHVLIIDDPIKNREEAESETYREKVWDSFSDDLYTRLEPGGAVVVMATRWHVDDLIGRLLRTEPEKWHRLNMPAIDDDGNALWAERFPIDVLRDIEATLGPYSWSALYQQNPTPAEGGIFKYAWFENRVSQPPEIVRAARFWDLAMSEKTTADYTVGWKMGQATDGHYYVLDVTRGQVEWGDLTEFMAQTILADGASVAQGIEEKGFMARAIQNLNADPRLHGYSVWGYPVDKDKVTRALPFAAKCAAGLIHMVNAHWTEAAIEELCSFPHGANDDQVDAASGAWTMLDEGLGVEYGAVNYAFAAPISQSAY